ncbi:MAG: RdgB/HAM1 family non-canonical purine NTP pyrophosphatase [Clostridiales bacterium]|nr:RdgB/HAM1 family non-canonical purine NTP pyrophosphatase [Clostridiales bacterium]
MERILVAATTNRHKITEISAILAPFGYRVISRADANVPDFEVEEDGETFEENSLLKARAIHEYLQGAYAVIADDSGLAADALSGAPGVYSARFADPASPEDAADYAAADRDTAQLHRSRQDRANNAKLLRLLAAQNGGEGVPEALRTARFVSVITLLEEGAADASAVPAICCRGEVEGRVAFAEDGTEGFGYDPLFIPDGYTMTFGQFAPEEKNRISHRSRALLKLREELMR